LPARQRGDQGRAAIIPGFTRNRRKLLRPPRLSAQIPVFFTLVALWAADVGAGANLHGCAPWRARVLAQNLEKTVLPVHPKALLALADGTVFTGISIGATGQTTGEVVFNTSITGYQEILTDPSYCQQIVTLTYPHIGNTRVHRDYVAHDRIHAYCLIIKELPLLASNFLF